MSTPYLVVEGTVVGHRTVDVPAREPREYTDRNGEKKRTRAVAASSFTEVGVNCPGLAFGEVEPDVRAVLPVRWPEHVAPPEKGAEVRIAVTVEQVKVWLGNNVREWLVYRYRGVAPEAAASVTSRKALTAVGS
jgi:hypothetical protein